MLFICTCYPASAQEEAMDEEPESVQLIESASEHPIPLDLRMPSEESIEKYRNDKRFRYEKLEPPRTELNFFEKAMAKILRAIGNMLGTAGQTGIFGWIVIVFIAVLLVLLIAKLLKLDIRSLIGKKKQLDEEIDIYTENVHDMKFELLINNALDEGDYRLAVRYLYLMNLKLLSDKGMIDWRSNKTNYSYQYEIKNSGIRSKFLQNTNIFDYVWYGEFPLDGQNYATIKEYMYELKNMVSNEE